MANPTLSVAICTYKRARSLTRVLESLQRAQPPGDLCWELLVIDNAPAADTRAAVAASRANLPLRYVEERRAGLSAARNRALESFRGGWLAFTDDDVEVDPLYLAGLEHAIAEYPDAGYFGGRIVPVWRNGPPAWLRDPSMALIQGLVGHYDLGCDNRRYDTSDPTPFGANFVLSRAVVEQSAAFRLDLGVRAGEPGAGEETEYLERLRHTGWSGYYLGSVCVYHHTGEKALDWSTLYRHGIAKGRTAVALGQPVKPHWTATGSALQFLLRGCLQYLKGRGDRARQCVINAGIQRGMRCNNNETHPANP